MHNFSEHLLENPARRWQLETLIFKRSRLFWSRFDSSDCESPSKCFLLSNFDIQSLESKRDQKRRDLLKISVSLPSSGWIFQKVLAEIVQKDLILPQKALISNRRNLGLFAPTSMRFP